MGIELSLYIALGNMATLTILILLIYVGKDVEERELLSTAGGNAN